MSFIIEVCNHSSYLVQPLPRIQSAQASQQAIQLLSEDLYSRDKLYYSLTALLTIRKFGLSTEKMSGGGMLGGAQEKGGWK